ERRMLNERTDKLNELAGITPVIIIITGILAIGITLFFFRKVLSDFNQKISLQKELQQKNDDIQARITAIENVASQISQGNYRIRLDQITKDGLGSLSVSLNKMAQSLQQSFDTLEEKEWLQAGIANLNEQMVGEKEIPVLVNDILVNVANFTECQVATVYVMGDDQLLHLEGSYAADQNLLKPVLHPGEGISGQCFQSGNP